MDGADDHLSVEAAEPTPPGKRAFLSSMAFRLFCLLMVAFALRVGFCFALGAWGESKTYREYVMGGARLLERGAFLSSLIVDDEATTPSALQPPVYTVIVAGAYALFGAESRAATIALQLLNAAASALAVGLVFAVGRRLGGDRAGWIAGVVAALNPTLAGFTFLIWDTSLFTLGVAVTVWLAERLGREAKALGVWLGFGLWLGFLALLNPAFTLAYPLVVLWPLVRVHGWRSGPVALRTGLVMLGWMVALSPWTIRNYVAFDRLMYVRNGLGFELWMGVCPEADTTPHLAYEKQFPLWSDEAQERVAAMGEQTFIDASASAAREAIRTEPGRYVRLVGWRALDYWLGTVFTHAPKSAGGWPVRPERALIALFLIVELLVLVLSILMRSRWGPDLPWLAGMVLVHSLLYCITQVQIRFRAPAETIMAVLIGVLVWRTWENVRGTPFGRRAGGG